MPQVLVIIMVGVLSVSFVAFCVLGLKHYKRTRVLTRGAYERKLHFSVNDPFNIPLRFRKFALIESGHSPRAHNITYGNVNKMPIRAFDFYYEVAHGPRRDARFYSTVVIQTPYQMKNVILWNLTDIEHAPIEFRESVNVQNNWKCLGDLTTGRSLGEILTKLNLQTLTVETFENTILVATPCLNKKNSYFDILKNVSELINEIDKLFGQHAKATPLQQTPDPTNRSF